jgi:hypothetical protein
MLSFYKALSTDCQHRPQKRLGHPAPRISGEKAQSVASESYEDAEDADAHPVDLSTLFTSKHHRSGDLFPLILTMSSE